PVASSRHHGEHHRGDEEMTTPEPQFIMDSVKLLVGDVTSPETTVKFVPPSRGNASTIQSTIYPPKATWTWVDDSTFKAQQVTDDDLGKYGLHVPLNTLFRLTGTNPTVWQPFQTGTTSTWTWTNITARNAERVTPDDVGKIGPQSDINTLFQLT